MQARHPMDIIIKPRDPSRIANRAFALGYNEFDFFLENEEPRPCSGCKWKSIYTFTKKVFFYFLSRFLARLASKLKKCSYDLQNILFLKKLKKGIKKRRSSC